MNVSTKDELKRGLRLIARRCEKTTGDGRCHDPHKIHLTVDREYTADKWCDPCIADAVLIGIPLRYTPPDPCAEQFEGGNMQHTHTCDLPPEHSSETHHCSCGRWSSNA